MSNKTRNTEEFNRLIEIMKRLRAPNGCPWDREQDYLSLRRYILEEAYELIEAIESGEFDAIVEECGDVLLQVVFVSQIAAERGDFDICDVLNYINSKLVRRHPHVFGNISVNNSDEVLKNWEQIKLGEKKEKHTDISVISGVPRALPALLRSYRIQEKASKAGFDWPENHTEEVLAKVDEEVSELKEAIVSGDKNAIADELGDVLFIITNLSRHLKIDPEIALHRSTDKFSKRFRLVEKAVDESGRKWEDFSLDELDTFWNDAKRILKEHDIAK